MRKEFHLPVTTERKPPLLKVSSGLARTPSAGSSKPPEPMRVGVLIHCLEPGGAQKMAIQICNILQRAGMSTHFLVLGGSREDWKYWQAHGLKAQRFAASRLSSHASTTAKIAWAPWQYGRLQRYVITHKIDAVLSFEDRANIFNLMLLRPSCRILSVRHPMVSVESLKTPVKRLLIRLAFRLLAQRASCLVFNARESLMEFHSYYKVPMTKLRVVPNCIDLDWIAKKAADCQGLQPLLQSLDQFKTVAACGRFKPVKGFHHLIRAFGRVAREIPDARLVLIGDGPERHELEALAKRLDLEDQVLFSGLQQNPLPWLAHCDVFVLSSLSEGFPNVLLEAMAVGTPAISTDCTSGPREILAPETDPARKAEAVDFASYGVLTPPLSGERHKPLDPLEEAEKALAEAMKTLLLNPELRAHYSAKATERAGEFACERHAHAWLTLLREWA